ncbi:MAG: hypothetical protein P1U56_03420 [Saprospiraceae bacterium]|nr:hypothetical protein [Saprospiraceae bacterium]
MKQKYKLTAFARIFIFLIFFTPVAFIGASYYNGEDGIAKIQAFFDKDGNSSIEEQIELKHSEIEQLTNKIESLKSDIARLEASK